MPRARLLRKLETFTVFRLFCYWAFLNHFMNLSCNDRISVSGSLKEQYSCCYDGSYSHLYDLCAWVCLKSHECDYFLFASAHDVNYPSQTRLIILILF